MAVFKYTLLRRTAVSAVVLLLANVCLRAQAPVEVVATRFLYILRNADGAQRPVLVNKLVKDGGQIAGDLFFPELGFVAIVGAFPQPVAVTGDAQVEVVRDVSVFSQGGPLGPAWAHNQFQQPADGVCYNDTPPVIYVVDTGISSGHPDFTWPAGATPVLTFAPGFSYAKNTVTNTPLPEYPDNHDHGTRVAGCLGGRVTGLLGPLGGRAVVKSIAIFDTPQNGNQLATFASQAISGILRAVTDHKARRALPYLKSRASVLVFAHTTRLVDGRFAAIDSAVEKAWQAGMHVVVSAGNEAVNAALVSPAGAAWGHMLAGPPPVLTRFWSGALPPGAVLYQAANEFTVAGGCDLVGGVPQLWAQTNRNAGPVTAVDGYAPGANVPCAAAVGPPYVAASGTSYSAGLTAAMITWEAWMRPWATPAMGRQWLNASMTLQAGGWMKVETPAFPPAGLTWAEWIEQYYPAATSTPEQRDPARDPDEDGVLNFVEYFEGGDPRFPDVRMDVEITVKPGSGGDRLAVRLPAACYLPAGSKVTWELEESGDLETWSPVSTSVLSPVMPPVIRGDGCLQEATASLTSSPRRMLRIKYTYTP
ncbi:MAG TPA: S8 family serine peptidase [Verrucomicrobiales bacterium]|nr:S8 family serine peptidase [Verrucomicrobiales bacterium]